MNLPDKKLNQILQQFSSDFPDITFRASETTYWDPRKKTIYYNAEKPNLIWSILHELGHMQAGHTNYSTDVSLLNLEAEAWHEAINIGAKYSITIDPEHIQDCLDSYREWLHNRSTCPQCKQTGLQSNTREYSCSNCGKKWQVSNSRFKRTYRKQIKTPAR